MIQDQCDFLHEDYCIFKSTCRFQTPVIQDGVLQTFPGCSATSEDIWRMEEKE